MSLRRKTSEPAAYAWRVDYFVNAKNSYGGYAGRKLWSYFFRGDKLVWRIDPGMKDWQYGWGRYGAGSRTELTGYAE